jgi:hypothetical protein
MLPLKIVVLNGRGFSTCINERICMIALIRKNKLISWCYAFCIGLIFRFILGHVNHLLFNLSFDFISLRASTIKSEVVILILTICLNIISTSISALISAIISGYLLFYVFRKEAFYYSLPALAIFLALNSRLWNFWKAPDLGTQISALMGPFLAAFVFLAVVWLFQKYLIKRMGNGDDNNLFGVGR